MATPCSLFVEDFTGVNAAAPSALLNDQWMCRKCGRIAAEHLHRQEQKQELWYKVSGAISRPTSHAGARYELFKLASPHGLYPPGLNAETAFETEANSQGDRSIIKFSVVFETRTQAASFVDGIKMYLYRNDGDLELLDDQGSKTGDLLVSEIPPFAATVQSCVLTSHYKPQNGEAEPGSPLVDMVVETRSGDITVDVTLLSTHDPVFRYQRIENDSSFALLCPESAHIFPSAKCTGIYEWLDKPDFNRLALSRDFHVNFDGTGRGEGKRPKTMQTFAIRPLRPTNGFPICSFDDCLCYRIPLELVLNENGIAQALLAKLGKSAVLNRNQGTRWTITGADVRVFYPQSRRVTLVTEKTDSGSLDLVTAIPGLENLNECWSNSQDDLYTLAEAELLEKCLLWNYENALESWRLV
eukprot:scaffold321_cov95-Cylindrotheca_fusiformis.AAC.12